MRKRFVPLGNLPLSNLEPVGTKGNDMKKKKYILLLILLSSIISYLSLKIPVYVSYAIDGVLFQHTEKIPNYLSQMLEIDKIKGLILLSGIIIVLNLSVIVVKYIRERITTQFTLKISSDLKKKLYAHILKLEYQNYQTYSKVEMLQRANDDAQEYANFYKVQFNLILDIISLSFFIVTQSIFLSVSVTVYLIVTIVLMLVFAVWYYQKMNQILEKVITKKKKMLGQTVTNINHFKFVRIFNRQKEEIQKYKRLNKDYIKEDTKFINLILFYEIISEHMTYLSDPIICLLGGLSIIRGDMTLGGLTALLLFAKKILGSLYSFGENLEVIDNFWVLRKRIKKLMKLEEEKVRGDSYNLDGDIVFHNVSVNVLGKSILKDLNFSIKKSEKIAIIGENGSGKSVLAKAILGFYPIEGNIYFNCHNSQHLNKANIREYIDFVSGDADLFTGTILENIQLDKKVTEEQLIKVVKEAEIEQDINKWEEGYQTIIGEKGVKLSGGQKQRILLARALLNHKPIMIFDNSFSKLDNKTTHKILQNLMKNYPQTTMIFITHKSEIENYSERIIKLEAGTSWHTHESKK